VRNRIAHPPRSTFTPRLLDGAGCSRRPQFSKEGAGEKPCD